MIDPAQSALPLHAFSRNWTQIQFDSINLQKPISDLTLPDLLWCLRKRIYPEQIIDLVLDKINDNWNKIDQHFTTAICEWYEEAIRLIITFPLSFWDTKHQTHTAFCTYIANSQKRNLQIEQTILDLFLSYEPQIVAWTKANEDFFTLNLGIGEGLGIAGNFIAAEREITKLKTAILNQQNVFIESTWCTLCTEETLLNFITHEYSEYGYLLDDIKASIIREQKIKTVPIPPL